MTPTPFNVGAFVLGAPTSPRALVRHADLLTAYADAALEDDREAYLSHFAFGAEMQTHYAANRQSVAGFAGPCWCRWLVLDIDRADLTSLRHLIYGTELMPAAKLEEALARFGLVLQPRGEHLHGHAEPGDRILGLVDIAGDPAREACAQQIRSDPAGRRGIDGLVNPCAGQCPPPS